METPVSTTRITRSQAQAMPSSENEESRKVVLNSREKSGKHQEREKSALIDITNGIGSPIVGLAMGILKTPSSTCSGKRRMFPKPQSRLTLTPGSGESLLRRQVKTLLQNVDEESVIPKICFENNFLIHKRFLNSPMAILAPTPANTPQLYNIPNSNVESFTLSPVAENFNFTQMLNEIISSPSQEDNGDSEEKDMITKSLIMDFSEKSELSDSTDCSSLLTYNGSDSSAWSTQVNASSNDEYKEDENKEEYEESGDQGVLDELCEGMSKISVNNGVKFTGKHTRFVYNSDGELKGELESSSSSSKSVSGVVCLKGLPSPKGKHLRFVEESEEEE